MTSHRLAGESAIRRCLKRAKIEGDLPAESSFADLTRYLSSVIYGITVLAAGRAGRKELQGVADVALRWWSERGNSR